MNPPTTTLLLLLSRYTFEYAGPAPEMTDYNVTTRWVGGAEEGEGGGGGGRGRAGGREGRWWGEGRRQREAEGRRD